MIKRWLTQFTLTSLRAIGSAIPAEHYVMGIIKGRIAILPLIASKKPCFLLSIYYRKQFLAFLAGIAVIALSACSGWEQIHPPIATKTPATTTPTATIKKTKLHQTASSKNTATNKLDSEQSDAEPAVPNPIVKHNASNLWDRLPRYFALPIPHHSPQVQAQIQWFLRHQDFLNRSAKRSAPYIYYILERVQERNLPAELALLPIIESAYYPMASSSVGATGLWQLMPGTANKFGLKQDWWYDGRRDIFASTNAALDYFTYLQNYFDGNWLLAIAAYDSGEGTVQTAVQRNANQGKSIDFWSLPLPQETVVYVPRLLALAELIRNRNNYPINLPPIDDEPYLGQIDVDSQIKLTDAARLAGLTLNEFKQLNPGYKHWEADPHGPYKITLPIDKIALFKENLGNGAAIPDANVTLLAEQENITETATTKVQQDATLADILPTSTLPNLGDDPATQAAGNNDTATEEAAEPNSAAKTETATTAVDETEPEAAHPPVNLTKKTTTQHAQNTKNLKTKNNTKSKVTSKANKKSATMQHHSKASVSKTTKPKSTASKHTLKRK